MQCRTDATLEEDLAAYIAREVCARVAPEHAAWTARFLASDSGGTSPIRVAQILEDEVERVAKTVRDMQAVLRQVAQFYKQARRLTSAAKVSRPSERHHALAALADHTRSNYPTVAPFIGLLEGGNTLGLPVQIGSDGTLRVDMRETGLPLPELRVKLKG